MALSSLGLPREGGRAPVDPHMSVCTAVPAAIAAHASSTVTHVNNVAICQAVVHIASP